jgi:hypothetical protein
MRFVWWPSEIRRLNKELELVRSRCNTWKEAYYTQRGIALLAEDQWARESVKVTSLQNEATYLKEQAEHQKQERRAIYNQRDELRRLIKVLCRNEPQAVPEWVDRPCDVNGNPVPVGD